MFSRETFGRTCTYTPQVAGEGAAPAAVPAFNPDVTRRLFGRNIRDAYSCQRFRQMRSPIKGVHHDCHRHLRCRSCSFHRQPYARNEKARLKHASDHHPEQRPRSHHRPAGVAVFIPQAPSRRGSGPIRTPRRRCWPPARAASAPRSPGNSRFAIRRCSCAR